MKKTVFIILSLFFFVTAQAHKKVAGVSIPANISYEGEKLNLKGVGVREKYWMDLYVGALYLNSGFLNANAIITSNEPMAIRLHIVSRLITSDKMTEAINEGFENSTNGNTSPFSSEILNFKNLFKENISLNDIFDLV